MRNMLNYYDHFYQDVFNTLPELNFSFEFFPPKSFDNKNNNFLSALTYLSVLRPKFVSITCTARNNHMYDYTYNAIQNIPKNLNLNIVPHITYVNTSDDQIKRLASNYWNQGIRGILALRGDVLDEMNSPQVYAYQLVSLLKSVADFDISVAAYPEIHPEAKNYDSDLKNLKKKIDCGANRAITQFFFDVDQYLRFRDKCVSSGINVEIIPGILPITNFHKLKQFVNLTNVYIPRWINSMFSTVNSSDLSIHKMLGLIISVKMIQRLCLEGVNNFHFYTLNHFDTIFSLCSILQYNIKK